jgi:hypothetical protein
MDYFKTGIEMLYIPDCSLLAEAGLKFNTGVDLGPGLKTLSCNHTFDFDRVLYYKQG